MNPIEKTSTTQRYSDVSEEDVEGLPHPYNTVKLRPFNLITDWFSHTNSRALAYLQSAYPVRTIIELGSWMGASTIQMARLLPDDGKLYAVDTFEIATTFRNDAGVLSSIEEQRAHWDQFRSNIIRTHMTQKVVPVKGTTSDRASFFSENGIKADLIYVDAAHQEEDVWADLTAYYPFLTGPRILCGDDYGWRDAEGSGPGPAIDRFAKEHKWKLHIVNGWFWYMIGEEEGTFDDQKKSEL